MYVPPPSSETEKVQFWPGMYKIARDQADVKAAIHDQQVEMAKKKKAQEIIDQAWSETPNGLGWISQAEIDVLHKEKKMGLEPHPDMPGWYKLKPEDSYYVKEAAYNPKKVDPEELKALTSDSKLYVRYRGKRRTAHQGNQRRPGGVGAEAFQQEVATGPNPKVAGEEVGREEPLYPYARGYVEARA
jgi:hypothetical protein